MITMGAEPLNGSVPYFLRYGRRAYVFRKAREIKVIFTATATICRRKNRGESGGSFVNGR